CWDEPDFKAVFSTTLVIDSSLTAVSNTAVQSERLEGGEKCVRFADAIRMSTYLVAFVVGTIEATEPVSVGRTPLRVWCVPGKRRLAKFGLEIGAFSLRFFEDYYGLPYPGDKLDLLAIPDFASGAMENLGAITFRETALLVDEQAATHAELERIAGVVAHENAHMWFGDLVTMSWWNGLWLNEAFATFMEMLAVDAWKPEWQRWTTFGVSRAAALSVDGLHSTRPIEFHVGAPRDADAMFDVLTYEKGASVLRMLEQHLGPAVFRDGVREYLRRHAYANADTGDLWAALGRAARQPIPAVMDGWIFQPGYPLVSARIEGGELVLSQERFTYLPEPLPGSTPAARDQRWQVPVQPRLAALVRSRATPVFEALGWMVRPGDDELTRQLRGDLVRALGVLGDDTAVQARAAELYAGAAGAVDPNVLPALIAVLAHAGDAARYDEFLKRFRSASTPQEEQRYLYALAGFRQRDLLAQTLARTINGEFRTQDAPFVVRSLLMSVYGRELAWEFVKTNWDTMERQYPKAGLRRLAEGVIGLATPELERDVHAFFQKGRIEFGGKTLEQYLEQLRIAVRLRERESASLATYLARVG